MPAPMGVVMSTIPWSGEVAPVEDGPVDDGPVEDGPGEDWPLEDEPPEEELLEDPLEDDPVDGGTAEAGGMPGAMGWLVESGLEGGVLPPAMTATEMPAASPAPMNAAPATSAILKRRDGV